MNRVLRVFREPFPASSASYAPTLSIFGVAAVAIQI